MSQCIEFILPIEKYSFPPLTRYSLTFANERVCKEQNYEYDVNLLVNQIKIDIQVRVN